MDGPSAETALVDQVEGIYLSSSPYTGTFTVVTRVFAILWLWFVPLLANGE